jgi:predicted ester cyclase
LIVEDGERAAVEGTFTGTHTGTLAAPQGEIPATGRTIELPYVDVFEARAGRIAAHRVYYDQMVMLSQLGLAPAPAA